MRVHMRYDEIEKELTCGVTTCGTTLDSSRLGLANNAFFEEKVGLDGFLDGLDVAPEFARNTLAGS